MMADFHVHRCGQVVHVDEWDEHLETCDAPASQDGTS